MNREYTLAAYALATAALLLAASGVVVVSGFGVADAGPAADSTPDSGPPNGTTHIQAGNATQINGSIVDSTNGTVTFTSGPTTCSGGFRVSESNVTRTDVQIDGTTVTVVSDDETPFETIERSRLATVVWNDVSGRVGLSESEHVELRVNQYYETPAREQPLDVAGITVRPTDSCLPTVTGEIALHNETIDIYRTLPALDELELTVTDEIGVLNTSDTAVLERLLVTDERASYTIQSQFDDPDSLHATVLEASNDGAIELELTAPAADSGAVLVTVDLDDETVRRATMVLEIDQSTIVTNASDGAGDVVSIEINSTNADA